jgi:hypothetical protein
LVFSIFYQLFSQVGLWRGHAGNDPNLGFDRTASGMIFNAYLIVYVILTPLTGFLTDAMAAAG